ncbi:uncharacterized protein LOC128678655 isoform X1 [Plodia interpunctella]|uniref:uncharacterized protein LOC128678655 isoform X1 n=1 Tax=Plodia interpunctella TaxID=58824 RepID=UPI002368D406|nr:uncharacterized protein LOC128678655 isoform X1 [Plodia interpunctella]
MLMEDDEKKSVWDFYNKCVSDDDNEKRAQCIICNNVYSYNSTIHNLKTHLLRLHKDIIPSDLDLGTLNRNTTAKAPKGQLRKELSEHSLCEHEEKLATCNYCKKQLSFKTTSGNLKTHLRRAHSSLFYKWFSDYEDHEVTLEEDSYITLDDNSEDEANNFANVYSCFEKEIGGQMHCMLCRASVSNNEGDLRRHLKKHPKVLGELQDLDVLLQDNDDEKTEPYTEVIYLDEGNIKLPKIDKNKWQSDTSKKCQDGKNIQKSNKKKRRRESLSSEDQPIEKRKQYNEIRKFGEYIMCLLEKLPQDVCMRMQMNIVNMIMNANLTKKHVNVSTETVPINIQSIPTEYYVLENHSQTSSKSPIQCPSTETVSNANNTCPNQSFSITTASNATNDVSYIDKTINTHNK